MNKRQRIKGKEYCVQRKWDMGKSQEKMKNLEFGEKRNILESGNKTKKKKKKEHGQSIPTQF